jgi:hypothetical protein
MFIASDLNLSSISYEKTKTKSKLGSELESVSLLFTVLIFSSYELNQAS